MLLIYLCNQTLQKIIANYYQNFFRLFLYLNSYTFVILRCLKIDLINTAEMGVTHIDLPFVFVVEYLLDIFTHTCIRHATIILCILIYVSWNPQLMEDFWCDTVSWLMDILSHISVKCRILRIILFGIA